MFRKKNSIYVAFNKNGEENKKWMIKKNCKIVDYANTEKEALRKGINLFKLI